MSDDFKQSFVQQVQQSSSTPVDAGLFAVAHGRKSSPLPDKTTIIIILICVSILLQIISLITLIVLPREAGQAEDIIEFEDDTPSYTYDDDGTIRTMSLTCESDQGYYLFYPSGDYEKYDLAFDMRQDTGTYSFIEEDVLLVESSTKGSSRLAYSGGTITDNSIQYQCNSGVDYDTSE